MKHETAEDLIEILSGMTRLNNVIAIDDSDKSLMFSLGKQCVRHIPFTDRQYDLAKRKILDYKEKLESLGIENVEESMQNLRMELRSIDRSKTISVVTDKGEDKIAVKFPFSKKMIKYIEMLNSMHKNKGYDKANKTHYISLNEKNLYKIVQNFKQANFEIQQELLDTYDMLENMNNNKDKYMPGIYQMKLQNLHNKAIEYAISSIGEPDVDNLALYKDRQQLLGIQHFDDADLQQSLNNLQPLTKRIIQRTQTQIFINKNEFTTNNVVESLLELHRFPLLVVVNKDDPLDGVHCITRAFNNIFDYKDFSVLFREENSSPEGREFNNYVKQNYLNNSLAISSKIVYINNNKLPKPLVQSEWQASAVLLLGSYRTNMKLDGYISTSDLVIHYDDQPSMFGQGFIEKI